MEEDEEEAEACRWRGEASFCVPSGFSAPWVKAELEEGEGPEEEEKG